MTITSLTEGLNSVAKELQILEDIESNEEHVTSTKQRIQKLLASYKKILCEKKKTDKLVIL